MFYGDPVGKWEGDTLVIDSTNFNRWALDDYYYTNPKEYRMHSDALHTIERIRWKSKDALSYELTIDDPKIFTQPLEAGVRDPRQARVGQAGAVRIRLRGEQSLPGRQVQGIG